MNITRLAGRTLRRILGNRHHHSELCEDCRRRNATASFEPELLRLQSHLSETCGGGVIGCPCGGVVTPIVNHQSFGLEIAALVCVTCHVVQALDEPGVFLAGGEVSARSAAVH